MKLWNWYQTWPKTKKDWQEFAHRVNRPVRTCRRRLARANIQLSSDGIPNLPKNRPWTGDEEDRLRKWKENGVKNKIIADRLNRTAEACRVRYHNITRLLLDVDETSTRALTIEDSGRYDSVGNRCVCWVTKSLIGQG
jgi:hypothetical protein